MNDIIKEGLASYKLKFETIGGKLTLYENQLKFHPHSFNIQKNIVVIDLLNIKSVTQEWNKLLGFVPIIPNILKITLQDECIYKFVVWERNDWINKIEKT